MKMRNVYLAVFILSTAAILFLSIGIKPDTTILKLFGYNIGLNFTHNLWLKLIAFVSMVLYVVTSKVTKTQA